MRLSNQKEMWPICLITVWITFRLLESESCTKYQQSFISFEYCFFFFFSVCYFISSVFIIRQMLELSIEQCNRGDVFRKVHLL